MELQCSATKLAGLSPAHSDPPPALSPSHVSLLQGVCRDFLVKFQRKGTTRPRTYDSMLYLQTFSPDLYRY